MTQKMFSRWKRPFARAPTQVYSLILADHTSAKVVALMSLGHKTPSVSAKVSFLQQLQQRMKKRLYIRLQSPNQA